MGFFDKVSQKVFLGLLMACSHMSFFVYAVSNQRQQQQMSASWVTPQSNHFTSNAPVSKSLPNSIWNRNVWYSWVQVMIRWPGWHILNTHSDPHTDTHTHTRFKGLTHPPPRHHHQHHFHPLLTVMSWLFEESQTLGQDSQGGRETGVCVFGRLNSSNSPIPQVIVPKKSHSGSPEEISIA